MSVKLKSIYKSQKREKDTRHKVNLEPESKAKATSDEHQNKLFDFLSGIISKSKLKLDQFQSKLLLFNAPYSLDRLKKIRMNLLVEMGNKGFAYYVNQMKTFVTAINQVMPNKTLLLDDDLWQKKDSLCEYPYWSEETEWLHHYYKKEKAKRLNQIEPTGIVTLTSIALKGDKATQLIGQADWMTKQQIILFQAIISTYYKNNVRLWPIHLNMDYTYLTKFASSSPSDNKNKLFAVLKSALSGSGTFIIKILQQINTANESKVDGKMKVSELASDIFKNVPPLTAEEFDYMKSKFQISEEYLKHMSEKTLGSASIAEAHFTWSEQFDTSAVIKFIKPIYAYYYLCEINYLLTTVWKNIRKQAEKVSKLRTNSKKSIDLDYKTYIIQCRRFLMFFIKEFTKEFDYEQEYINTSIGYKVYQNPKTNLYSVKGFHYAVDPFPYIILQRVYGESLDDLLKSKETSKHRLKILYKRVDSLIKQWFKTTLWGRGFFHADLHPGNILMGGETEYQEHENQMYILDYGSCGRLEKHQQCKLITAMLLSNQFIQPNSKKGSLPSSRVHNVKVAKKFIETIWSLCDVTETSKEHLDQMVEIILKSHYYYFSTMFLDVIEFSQDIGTCSNNAILLFGRAVAYLGNMMAKVTKLCDDPSACPVWGVDQAVRPNLIRHPWQLLRFYMFDKAC